MITLGDYFITIFIPADSKEFLHEEIEMYRIENERLNPRFKIFPTKIVPDPETIVFTKGYHQMFDVVYEYEINLG